MSKPLLSTPPLPLPALSIAPAQVIRGIQILQQVGPLLQQYGQRPLIIGGQQALAVIRPRLLPVLEQQQMSLTQESYVNNCSEKNLVRMHQAAVEHQADFIIGVGGGKALDAAKLLAYQTNLSIVTIPTTAATCAAWTALSNVYTDTGTFQYDVGLAHCPNLLLLDYEVIATAPQRTLVAGIGDALAKWYEASISSGHSQQTLLIAAVQQARILRDILLQKSVEAIAVYSESAQLSSTVWQEVIDASVLMAGVIGGLGGAQCRTVAAHAVHNGLTHLAQSHNSLHGEKVAYGILVQLRLEEVLQGSQLAATARQQLIKFYQTIGLPLTLKDLGLGSVSLEDLEAATEMACAPESDIHRLPFAVTPVQLLTAMVSTTAPSESYSGVKTLERSENQDRLPPLQSMEMTLPIAEDPA